MRFKVWNESEGYEEGEEWDCEAGEYQATILSVPVIRGMRNGFVISVYVKRSMSGGMAKMDKWDLPNNITEAKALAEKMADQLEKLV